MNKEIVEGLLSYCKETGLFTWKVRKGTAKAGDIAGCKNCYGYIIIRINGTLFKAHRLVWLLIYGCWPSYDIDHINGVKDDNRFINLRDVTRQSNATNIRRAKTSNKSSGLLGASWHKSVNRWRASIRVNGKIEHLGYFDSAKEAHEKYIYAKRKYHKACTI